MKRCARADVITMRCCIYIFVLFLTLAKGDEADLRRIDSIVQEEPCVSAGGICTVSGDCPKGHLSEKPGLCPQQRKEEIECCYGVSLRETRCEKHGGVCMSPEEFCNPKLVFDGARDCPKTHRCCIMAL